jgi:hypothetical protein
MILKKYGLIIHFCGDFAQEKTSNTISWTEKELVAQTVLTSTYAVDAEPEPIAILAETSILLI